VNNNSAPRTNYTSIPQIFESITTALPLDRTMIFPLISGISGKIGKFILQIAPLTLAKPDISAKLRR